MKRIWILCLCSFLLYGCTKSNIVQDGGGSGPDMELKEGLILDWESIGNQMDEILINSKEYEGAVSINYSIDEEKKFIDLVLIVENMDKEQVLAFANNTLRVMNDEAATQDFSYALSSETSYGGLFQTYDLLLQVIPDGHLDNKETWIVDMEIPAGSDLPIALRVN